MRGVEVIASSGAVPAATSAASTAKYVSLRRLSIPERWPPYWSIHDAMPFLVSGVPGLRDQREHHTGMHAGDHSASALGQSTPMEARMLRSRQAESERVL